MALSLCICFTSYIISFYTCKLIIDTTDRDADFCITLKRYYGNFGYYTGILFPLFMLLSTVIVLFIILSELLYPILLSLYTWCDPDSKEIYVETTPVLNDFSSAYTAIMLYFLLVLIISKKNLGVFIRLGSMGAVFVGIFIIGIMGLSAYAFTNTSY